MRIRSILPNFYRSEDVGAMDWDTRLLFIGLWSYVDDNGVGRDVPKLIVADLFPFDDSADALARVSRGLQTLSDGGQITRYTIDDKPLLFVNQWDVYQRVDRPGKARYERPTCDDAVIRENVATLSRVSHDTPLTGEGEKGRRGEGEKTLSSTADAVDKSDDFDTFWSLYPRKVAKGAAVKAWKTATRKADAEVILSGLKAQAQTLVAKGADFCPHAATWLNAERWADDLGQPDTEGGYGWAHVPTAEDLRARRGWDPECPECERPNGRHFQGCSRSAQ